MIVVMRRGAAEAEISEVVRRLTEAGCRVRRDGMERVILGTSGGDPVPESIGGLVGVQKVQDSGQYVLASRDLQPEDSVFEVGNGVTVGGDELLVMAGPCSVEDEEGLDRVAAEVADAGATGLRAGAYKPRTGPYAFQGLGEEGYYLLRKTADRHGLLVVSEVLEPSHLPLAEYYCDILQVGARNMQNGALLRELGRSRKPVLLKRGLSATIEEWLAAAEYVLSCGNDRVILCERGIRTFETATRNTLDLSAIPAAKERTHLPVVADPSHGTGKRSHVRPMARAAVAAGADGLLVEVHVDPDAAVSDAAQTVDVAEFRRMMREVGAVAAAVGRTLSQQDLA